MRYLLDTNILSALIRDPHGRIADQIAVVGTDNVYTSVIVAAELRYGAIKNGSRRLVTSVNRVLDALAIAPLQVPADQVYGSIAAILARAGTPIGANDLFIAAHALARGSVLVTDNVREFARVPGLTVENWLRSVPDPQAD